MPHPNAINPATGKRYSFVPPEKRSAAAQQAEKTKQNDQQILLLKRQLAAVESRERLLTFTKFMMPDPEAMDDASRSKYEAARFHEEIAKVLEQVEDGRIPLLIFCMPPRHGKTQLATKSFAAWYSGRHPDHDVIVAAAGDDLAADMGADTRAIMTSPQYKLVFPRHKLRRGGTAKDNIQTDKGGRLIFAGRGGQINGRGAHLLLIDDLYKDDKEARSQTIRDDAWNWFTRVALKRRMGKKLVVVTMTRWHSDDLIGRLTDPENPHYNEDEAKTWKIIRLPGLAEDDDPLGRKPGQALWPERYDEEYHAADRRRDPLGFEALVQQRPTVADGVLFRRENIRYYDTKDLPEELRVYCASDHAVGTKQRNDPSCFVKIGVDREDNIYILDCWWKRARTDEAVEAMLTMGATGNRRPLIWWAERGQITGSIGPFLRKRMQETGQYINVIEVTPKADKEQRAQSIAARVAMGRVLWPNGPDWTERSINELMAFPNGTHDDFVDALAYIGLGLPRQVRASAPPRKQDVPKFGTLAWVKYTAKWHDDEAKRKAMGGF
jgi:predicted phage terminase large subunit-like protein